MIFSKYWVPVFRQPEATLYTSLARVATGGSMRGMVTCSPIRRTLRSPPRSPAICRPDHGRSTQEPRVAPEPTRYTSRVVRAASDPFLKLGQGLFRHSGRKTAVYRRSGLRGPKCVGRWDFCGIATLMPSSGQGHRNGSFRVARPSNRVSPRPRDCEFTGAASAARMNPVAVIWSQSVPPMTKYDKSKPIVPGFSGGT
jgi:hypothetical protein